MLCVILKYYSRYSEKKKKQQLYLVQKPVLAHERPLHFQLTLARDKGIFLPFRGKLLVKSTFQGLIFIHIYFIKFMSGYSMMESPPLLQASLSHLHVYIFLPTGLFLPLPFQLQRCKFQEAF